MRTVTTIVVGAGQAGLAASRALSEQGVEHLVLERGGVGHAWRKERWESLRMLTPNWANGLPGVPYWGPAPHGYMSALEFAARLEAYAHTVHAPVQRDTRVERAWRTPEGYRLQTSQGPLACRTLIVATGACQRARLPAVSAAVPADLVQITPDRYRRPSDLPEGGVLVVGASASGVQLAREIQLSGRPVTLAVGGHTRLPRNYRGRDIEWWLDSIGALDVTHEEIDDLERARRTPSPQIMAGIEPVDLNALQDIGVEIAGRLGDIRDGHALFSGGLANACASADLKMTRLLRSVDAWIQDWGMGSFTPHADVPAPTRLPATPILRRSLTDGRIRSVLWTTGYAPDFSWLDLPAFDARGRLRHHGGVGVIPGLYVLGLPFLRRRRSHQISGVGGDARAIGAHLRSYLDSGAGLAA
ncbi:MAG: NAD(P)/FAD-dependent oxidoreductase [Pseudomonadota bacterium]